MSDEPTGLTLDELRPASGEVRQELVALRQRDGASSPKLRTCCPSMRRLPATEDHLRKTQLNPADWHVAAFQVLTCAVANLRRTDLNTIASGTLNFGGDSEGLDRRRDRLMLILHLSPKEYDRREQLAYDELADRLVAAQRSPCQEPGILEEGDEQAVPLAVGMLFVQVLQSLTVEERRTARQLLFDQLLSELPSAQAALADESMSRLTMADLLSVLLRSDWPPTSHLPTVAARLLGAAQLDHLITGHVAWELRHTTVFADWTAPSKEVLFESPVTSDFYNRLHYSVLILAAHIEAIEIDGRWTELLQRALNGQLVES
jgi:hypothetical protein